ncbi:MAG: GNAT family N-acetyltransferase, partial [Gaiellaceae bacterium]
LEGVAGVRIARTVAEVEELRPLWESASVDELDADIDYYLDVVRGGENVIAPHVVVLDRADRDSLLIIAKLIRDEVPIRIGYLTLGRVTIRSLVLSFGGVVGARSEEDVAHAVAALSDQLQRGEADMLYAPKIDVASPLFAALNRLSPRRRSIGRPMPHWTVELAHSWTEFLDRRSGSSRRRLRHDDSKFERAFPDGVVTRRLDLPEHRHRLIEDLAAVTGQTYQHALGVSLSGTDLETYLMARELDRDRLRVWMVYVDEQPVAFWWGVLRAGVLYIGSTGYHHSYAHARAGYYAMRRMLEDLNDDPKATAADFGSGDADYKERFGTRLTVEADVGVYGDGRRPRTLKLLLGSSAQVDRAGKWLIERTGHTAAVKRWLRRRAVETQGVDAPRRDEA